MSIEQTRNFSTLLASLQDGQYLAWETKPGDDHIAYISTNKKPGNFRTADIVRCAKNAIWQIEDLRKAAKEGEAKNVPNYETEYNGVFQGLEKYYTRVAAAVQKKWWYRIASAFGYRYEGPKEIRDLLLKRPLTLPQRDQFYEKLIDANTDCDPKSGKKLNKQYLVRKPDGNFESANKKPSFFRTNQIAAIAQMCVEMQTVHAKGANSVPTPTFRLNLLDELRSFCKREEESVKKRWGFRLMSLVSTPDLGSAPIRKVMDILTSVVRGLK